jgi:hypothetical protein
MKNPKVSNSNDLKTSRATATPKVMDKEPLTGPVAKVDEGWMVPNDYVPKLMAGESDTETMKTSLGWSMSTGEHCC